MKIFEAWALAPLPSNPKILHIWGHDIMWGDFPIIIYHTFHHDCHLILQWVHHSYVHYNYKNHWIHHVWIKYIVVYWIEIISYTYKISLDSHFQRTTCLIHPMQKLLQRFEIKCNFEPVVIHTAPNILYMLTLQMAESHFRLVFQWE